MNLSDWIVRLTRKLSVQTTADSDVTTDDPHRCTSTFTAEKQKRRQNVQYPINGLFGSACSRHEIVKRVQNVVTSGES